MQKLMAAGILIILAGFALIVAGSAPSGSASVGGVIFIGPFPIAFGSGPGSGVLAIGSAVLGGVMLIAFLVWGFGKGSMTGTQRKAPLRLQKALDRILWISVGVLVAVLIVALIF